MIWPSSWWLVEQSVFFAEFSWFSSIPMWRLVGWFLTHENTFRNSNLNRKSRIIYSQALNCQKRFVKCLSISMHVSVRVPITHHFPIFWHYSYRTESQPLWKRFRWQRKSNRWIFNVSVTKKKKNRWNTWCQSTIDSISIFIFPYFHCQQFYSGCSGTIKWVDPNSYSYIQRKT